MFDHTLWRTDMAKEMKIACFIGAAAGITPLVVSLISVEAELILDIFAPKILIGYLIKTAGLMALGAFVVFVNSESDYKKAFQLGIMAPALIVGTINASNFSDAKREILDLESELGGHSPAISSSRLDTSYLPENSGPVFSLIGNAYAGGTNNLAGKHNAPSTASLIWYGMAGKISNGWFVIVGSHTQKREADSQARQLKNKGYDARTFPSLENSGGFSVAIGSYLSLEEARTLRQKALADGLSKDTRLWKWK